jgi:hypothetical protein
MTAIHFSTCARMRVSAAVPRVAADFVGLSWASDMTATSFEKRRSDHAAVLADELDQFLHFVRLSER